MDSKANKTPKPTGMPPSEHGGTTRRTAIPLPNKDAEIFAKRIANPAPVSKSEKEAAKKAYEAFNKVYLDTDKYIYKNTDRDRAALSRSEGAAAIWCQPKIGRAHV